MVAALGRAILATNNDGDSLALRARYTTMRIACRFRFLRFLGFFTSVDEMKNIKPIPVAMGKNRKNLRNLVVNVVGSAAGQVVKSNEV